MISFINYTLKSCIATTATAGIVPGFLNAMICSHVTSDQVNTVNNNNNIFQALIICRTDHSDKRMYRLGLGWETFGTINMYLFICLCLELDSGGIVHWLQNHTGMFQCMNSQSHCRRTTCRLYILLTLEITLSQCGGGREEEAAAPANESYIHKCWSQNGLQAFFLKKSNETWCQQ